MLLCMIKCNRERRIIDYFIGGVCSGCVMLSITCGVQCLTNSAMNMFYGEDPACQIEAIAHVSSILTQFFNVTLMALAFWDIVVWHHNKKPILTDVIAFRTTIGVWIVCVLITGLLSLDSPIYLVSAGTYCFFTFDSFAIAGWLLPGLILALVTIATCHMQLWRFLRKNATREYHLLEFNYIIFGCVLLVGWGFAAIASVYELGFGRSPEWLVTGVGVGGVSFSWMFPVSVFYQSSDYRKMVVTTYKAICTKCIHTKEPKEASKSIQISVDLSQ